MPYFSTMIWLKGSKRSKVAVITVIQSLDEFLFDYAPTEKIFVTSDAGKFTTNVILFT